MSAGRSRWLKGMSMAAGAFLIGACAVTGIGVGVGYDEAGYGYGGGFYEPYGYEYGGWDRGYRVGPPRGGDRRSDQGPGGRPYRSAPSSRPMPGIPGRPRGR